MYVIVAVGLGVFVGVEVIASGWEAGLHRECPRLRLSRALNLQLYPGPSKEPPPANRAISQVLSTEQIRLVSFTASE